MTNIDISFSDVLTPIFIYHSDTWEMQEVNKAALDLYEYSREEMLSMQIGDIHPQEELPALKEYISSHRDKTHREAGTWQHVTKSGKTLYVQIYSYQIEYEGKECRLIFVQDVTRQQQLKKKLETEKELFDLLVEKLPGSVYLFNRSGKMLRWNERLEELTGYSSQEIENMEALDFVPQSENSALKKAISTAFEEGYAEVESYMKTRQETTIPTYFKGTKITVEDQTCVLGVGIDISRQKKNQDRIANVKQFYQSIMDQASSMIWVKDAEQRFLFVNQAFLNFFGLSKDEVIGKYKSNVLNQPDLTSMQQTDQDVLNSREPLEAEEVVYKDNKEYVFLTSKFLLDHDIGFGDCICGISTDITERKNAEKELKKALKERETLLAEVHHRVKNNLAVVTGMMHLQSMKSQEPEVKDKLESSMLRIHSIALIHELLYQSESLNDINLGKHLKYLINQIAETLYNESDIKIKLNLEPVKLNVNQALPCANIANELITNAYKHAFPDRESGTITVTLYEENEYIYLSIADNGVGIPDDIELSESKSLGFDLINNLIKQLNGQLEYRDNNGSHFTIHFKKESKRGSASGLIQDSITNYNQR